MKKMFGILLILSVVFSLPVVYAHDIVTDPDDIVQVAVDEKGQISSKTKAIVHGDFGEYTLSYQYVKFDEDDFESYKELTQNQLEYEENNKPSTDEEDMDVIKEYQDRMAQYEKDKQAVTPGFVEAKWIESKDGTVPLDKENIKNAKGDEVYALWVKVTSKTDSNKVVYEDNVVIYQITEEEKSPSTSDNMLVIGVLAIITIGFVAVSYKKSKA